MVDPRIFHTTAFNVIEKEFKSVIQESLTYICDNFLNRENLNREKNMMK